MTALRAAGSFLSPSVRPTLAVMTPETIAVECLLVAPQVDTGRQTCRCDLITLRLAAVHVLRGRGRTCFWRADRRRNRIGAGCCSSRLLSSRVMGRPDPASWWEIHLP